MTQETAAPPRLWSDRGEDFLETMRNIYDVVHDDADPSADHEVEGAAAEAAVNRIHSLCIQLHLRDVLRDEMELIVQAAKDDAHDAVWEYLRSIEGAKAIQTGIARTQRKST